MEQNDVKKHKIAKKRVKDIGKKPTFIDKRLGKIIEY